jgi:L-ascorbate metabolism protein UlaG (beta-lactamase superfamily)
MSSCCVVSDPIFSNRLASIFTKRISPMEFDPSAIGDLDAVLISHGHHDHMDIRSLKALGKRRTIILPRGVSFPLKIRGFHDLRAAKPWDEMPIGNATITVVPSHHFGGRPPLYFKAKYQGYVIAGEKCVYFAGDTGFDEEIFTSIRSRFDLDLALLPIGAYHPPSFRKHHMSPEDAVEAFRILGAKIMVPIHFETFSLSLEPVNEPRKRLVAAAEKAGVADSVFILSSGESLCLDGSNVRHCSRVTRPTESSRSP